MGYVLAFKSKDSNTSIVPEDLVFSPSNFGISLNNQSYYQYFSGKNVYIFEITGIQEERFKPLEGYYAFLYAPQRMREQGSWTDDTAVPNPTDEYTYTYKDMMTAMVNGYYNRSIFFSKIPAEFETDTFKSGCIDTISNTPDAGSVNTTALYQFDWYLPNVDQMEGGNGNLLCQSPASTINTNMVKMEWPWGANVTKIITVTYPYERIDNACQINLVGKSSITL